MPWPCGFANSFLALFPKNRMCLYTRFARPFVHLLFYNSKTNTTIETDCIVELSSNKYTMIFMDLFGALGALGLSFFFKCVPSLQNYVHISNTGYNIYFLWYSRGEYRTGVWGKDPFCKISSNHYQILHMFSLSVRTCVIKILKKIVAWEPLGPVTKKITGSK